ncbi:peptidase D [Heterostelium album PN500]|uniref:Xaa-Pro dipeptidase n=1 Tax=Heterostelium pallidum (strain ATCC 26659 / Pp 5 / PN500) TaxID=670386 RepID=D3BP59_HETP5|nr:peptidase D [Heterostelium album PN500]EFA77069.1 peptidase D [Heterostelium album PN500]|eukprot:XP_020429198.1 peptidase D [Heterostelium album PN500]
MSDGCCEETHKDSHYSPGYYWLGNDTLKVPLVLHRENRQRLAKSILTSKDKDSIEPNSFVLFQAGKSTTAYDTDHEPLFRQEKFFFWAFGSDMPDCYGVVALDSQENPTSTLFIPRLPAEYATWLGQIHSKEYYKKIFLVDNVEFADEMTAYLKNLNCSTLYTVAGLNTDSHNHTEPLTFKGIEEFKVNTTLAFPYVAECRVFKTPKEIEVLRYSVESTCKSHMQVMRKIRPGMKEYQCESIFLYHAYHDFGCRNVGYTCICAANKNSSVLHYGHAGEPNASTIRDGAMCLYDMGAEYHGYTADVTCSFPANGKFTEDQKIVYNAVLDASQSVIKAMKPGVEWIDMHKLAENRILSGLLAGGILVGSLEELVENKIGSVFFPHGLGHLLGLDTHDVGGYQGDAKPKVNSLRTTRSLIENMFITVEPGCYFIDHLLDQALADPSKARFFNRDVLARFRNFGGVRIEDDVLVTATGCENFSKMVPRTVEEIEAYMKH